MHTAPECIPCFFKQAFRMAAKSSLSSEEQMRFLLELMGRLSRSFDAAQPPPVHAAWIQEHISSLTGIADPFLEEKQLSNREALAALPEMKRRTAESADELREAVLLAIAGNIIDFGIMQQIDVASEIDRILKQEREQTAREESRLFAYERLRSALSKASTLMYLGDNNGEAVFDRLLIEQITAMFPHIRITYAAREVPVLNDVTVADALSVGLDRRAMVISSGSRIPGTLLQEASQPFADLFSSADVVISKGQGNFESLSGTCGRPVFYLFMAKCRAVADYIGAQLGDIILTEL